MMRFRLMLVKTGKNISPSYFFFGPAVCHGAGGGEGPEKTAAA